MMKTMINKNPVSSPRQTRVLFLAFGFSIHAKRRIQLFIDDPDFSVAVVSTYNYNFENAKNILLTGAQEKTESFVFQKKNKIVNRLAYIIRAILLRLFHKIITIFDKKTSLHEVDKWIEDLKTVISAAKNFKPDIIFLQTLLYPCYLSYLLPRSYPIIITFWNGDVIWWAKWNGIERLLKKQIVRYGVHRAQAITVNSQTAFNACLGYGVQSEKVHLIRYPGVDLKKFKPSAKEEARKKLGITSKKVVLCPRGFGEYLNSDIIIESAAIVVKKYPDTSFLFISGVGGETEWKKHQHRAHELGIEKNIRWDGQVAWGTITRYYSSADVMVSISSNDSLPNSMLEAMACSVPVIMGDIPQIREWVVDGVNGFLVPLRDPVVLSDRILKVFEKSDGNIEKFTKRSLEFVMREADSEKNIKLIKELVHRIAGNTS